MKNPPDYLTVGITGLCSLISLAFTIFELQLWFHGNGASSEMILVSIIAGAFASIFFITIGLFSELVLRPWNVEVDEEIRFDWKYKGSSTFSIDSVSDLFIESRAHKSSLIRKSGGSVGFKDEKKRIALTYEIAKAIKDKYIQRFGHAPPLPAWAKK